MRNLIEFILVKILKGLNIENATQKIENLTQFVMFGIVGISNTVISYLINILVLTLLRPYRVSLDYVVGNIVAFILSVLWSFYWNNRFVFIQKEGQHRNLWKTLLKTYFAYGFTGIIINNILSWLWVTIFHISKYIAPLINMVISVPLNFIINKLWAYGENGDPKY